MKNNPVKDSFKALSYYLEFKESILKMQVEESGISEPTLKSDPEEWNGKNWNWFFDVEIQSKIM